MRTLLIVAIVFLSAVSCSKNNNNNNATNQVAMVDFSFNPDSLSISVGDTVTWVNQGAYDHTTTSGEVNSPDGLWDSGAMAPGAKYSHVFAAAGNFHYYCALHGASNGMKGVIAVH